MGMVAVGVAIAQAGRRNHEGRKMHQLQNGIASAGSKLAAHRLDECAVQEQTVRMILLLCAVRRSILCCRRSNSGLASPSACVRASWPSSTLKTRSETGRSSCDVDVAMGNSSCNVRSAVFPLLSCSLRLPSSPFSALSRPFARWLRLSVCQTLAGRVQGGGKQGGISHLYKTRTIQRQENAHHHRILHARPNLSMVLSCGMDQH